MPLERLLQINMATLAALGALLLGMGQQSVGAPLLVVAAAVGSVWMTDIKGWFSLGRWPSNGLMLLAAAYAMYDFSPYGGELQALSFARLLVWIQVVLLFQRKNERTYWLLVMLSLLQVVVAALFSQGALFGLLLAVYMMFGFSAMTLLSLHRQLKRHRRDYVVSDGDGEDEKIISLSVADGQAAVGPYLFRRLGRMGMFTLALTIILFFALPRFGQDVWRGAVVQQQQMVGFTDDVSLGELGKIIESREEVMRVRFVADSDEKPEPIHGEVYLQGAVLTNYNHGQWSVGRPSLHGSEQLQRARYFPSSGIMRQEIEIGGMDRDELFYVAPYIALRDKPYIILDNAKNRLRRTGLPLTRKFKYTLGTTAIVNRVQKPLTPHNKLNTRIGAKQMPSGEGTWGLPKLKALAQEWIEESGLPPENRYGRAKYLERKLASSTRFKYSLVGQDRNPDLDPIEDFISEHPLGHCEYFATALVLMLRSQGIPARLISGYMCDQWDSMGGYYKVRQLNAHTWVEAYLRPSQIPADLKHGGDYWGWDKRGGWLRLDPTPAGAGDERKSWLDPLHKGMDWVESIWSNYVVGLDYERQRKAVYKPIVDAARQVWQTVSDPKRWRAIFNSVSVALYLDHLGREVRWMLLGFIGMVAAAGAALVGWKLWKFIRRISSGLSGNRYARTRRRTKIEFYRRFESLLARRGIVRAAGQTQREFAATAGARLAALTGRSDLELLPSVVVEAFYRLRFGRLPLDSEQTLAVEHAISEIALSKTVGGGSCRRSL